MLPESPIVSSPLVEHGFGAKLQVHGSEYAHRRDDDAVACSSVWPAATCVVRHAMPALQRQAGGTTRPRVAEDRIGSVQVRPPPTNTHAQRRVVTDEGDSG